MNIDFIPSHAKKLTEYYEPAADIPSLPLQQLEISHPDSFVPVKRMVSVHNIKDDQVLSTVSSVHSKRPSKPLPQAPVSQRKENPPTNIMSPLTLPQQLSPIIRQSKPVYNSIFGGQGQTDGDSEEAYSSMLIQNYNTATSTSLLDQPARDSQPASVHSRLSTFNSTESSESDFLSPTQVDYLDCSDDEGASLYSYHSMVSNHRSILSKRSMELISEIPNTEEPLDHVLCVDNEEEADNTPYILPNLGTMGGGWKLSVQNPSPPSPESDDEASSREISPATPTHDDSVPLRKKGSKELVADNLFLDYTEEPIRAVSPFWQQISPVSRTPSQTDYFLQPTTFIDPTRACSPVSSIGTSSFTGSVRQFSGSDFSNDTRSSSPGLNSQQPIVDSVNEIAASQDFRTSWAGPSSEWIQSMNSVRQRSSVPPPPVPKPVEEPIVEKTKSRYSIASHSLTNDPDTVKTMRRMANLTKDPNTQIVYALYLLEVCQMHEMSSGGIVPISSTRQRLLKEAVYWIERLSKERHGEASYIKGLWYQQGLHGFKKSEDKAYRMYQTAAKSGHVKAKFKLGQHHEKKCNTAKAVAFYKSATVKGGVEPNFKMAQILLYGELKQKRNLKLGLEYLRRAADLACATTTEPALIMGQILIGEFKKVNIPKDLIQPDYKVGVKYILKAAELGNADALDRMARAYQFGELEQTVDLTESFRYYEKAAERGQVQSMLSLSKMYLDGQAVDSNEALAFKWCERSAVTGFDHAEFALGYYYEMGIGVAADYPRALEYYGKAATKGHEAAAAALNRNDNDVVHNLNHTRDHVVGKDSKAMSKECALM